MKFTTIMAVMAVALAFATTGCRYDKSGAEAADNGNVSSIGADENEAGGNVADINAAEAAEMAAADADSGDLGALAGEGRFEDMYRKCSDVSFSPVYFGFDSTMIPPAELGKAEAVAAHLREHADRVVVVEGNCDERGSNEYNMSLGETRAVAIRNFLVQNEISADRIQTRSFGEEKPAVDGHDESAWKLNRRGEFSIYQK